MNEGKARERLARGERAKALLRDEILTDAFTYLDEQFLQAWRQTPVNDTDARERLYYMSQALASVKGYIEGVVSDGKLAQATLDELSKRQQK
jgi:hypothetical protein